jgi:hypothetical protein
MRAHVIEDGVVVNTIEVESLDFLPNLVAGDIGSIGWVWDGEELSDPNALTQQELDELQWAIVRAERNKLLANCDWTQLPDASADAAAWAIYRQALRDITSQANPFNIVWPAEPI